jgi:hypothetical protein
LDNIPNSPFVIKTKAEMITPIDAKRRRVYMITPPRDLSFFGTGIVRVVTSSTAPYPDLDPSPFLEGDKVGEGGGELTANSHIINPSPSLLVSSSNPDNEEA